MSIPIYQVDAFTAEPFAGNPAGVCILSAQAPDAWMKNVAREMNLSETAFLLAEGDGYRLRWFTPKVEMDLCGHATLGSAHILWETGRLPLREDARFFTRSGLLTAHRDGDWICLDFPAAPARPVPEPPGLSRALGIGARQIAMTDLEYVVFEVETEAQVRAVSPDFGLLKEVPMHGAIVTSRADTAGFDFVSRFFAPRLGVNEDPVTGSSHCALGPYWGTKLGKTGMLAYQASERGGVMQVALNGSRVLLSGQAVTTIHGELC